MVAITYWSPIDAHVHLRGEEYAHIKPSYAEQAFADARAVHLRALVEQPNPMPYLDSRDAIENRKRYIDGIRGNVDHAMAIAITGEEEQIQGALKVIHDDPRVPSGKTFYCRTTKSEKLEIILPGKQQFSWEEISRNPNGEILREGHLEDETFFKRAFDPSKPETHAYRQDPDSEPAQFERQFGFAYDAGFRGVFLVKHTSNPDTIDLGDKLIQQFSPKFRVMYETTPHHMWLNIEEDYPLHGNRIKMNPPLRPKRMQERLLEYVVAGRMHTISTDHAPHPDEEKTGPPHKSGIPVIPIWPKVFRWLREAKVSSADEFRLTFHTANQLYFKGKLAPIRVTVEYDPSLWDKYGNNPFKRVDGTLKAA